MAAIIGGFLTGMALSEALPHRVHDPSHRVTELLLPFFLADIGLHFSLDAFATRSTLLAALPLDPVAVLARMVGCGLGTSRVGRVIAMRVGVGMIPRGEFRMVVVQVGPSLKAITPASYATLDFMAVVAAILTPPLLKRAFRGVLTPAVESEGSFRPGSR